MQPFIPLHSRINGLIQKQLTGGERMWPCGWWSTVWRASSQGLEYNHRPHTREHTCTYTYKHTHTHTEKTIYILLERSQNIINKRGNRTTTRKEKEEFFLNCVLIFFFFFKLCKYVCTFMKLLFTFHYTLYNDNKGFLFYFPNLLTYTCGFYSSVCGIRYNTYPFIL